MPEGHVPDGGAPDGESPDGAPQVPEGERSGDVWLFGYGSLIWRPDVEFSAARPAILRGYRRRFWQRSTDHRGTAEAPGRVVTLVPEEGGRVVGMAYRLVDAAATLQRVDVREQQGYTRLSLPVELGHPGLSAPHGAPVAHRQPAARSPEYSISPSLEPALSSTVAAVVYVADPANPYFVAGEDLSATARVIATAHGPSGANLEYARRLVAALGELAAAHGERLAFRVEDFAYERELLALAEGRS